MLAGAACSDTWPDDQNGKVRAEIEFDDVCRGKTSVVQVPREQDLLIICGLPAQGFKMYAGSAGRGR